VSATEDQQWRQDTTGGGSSARTDLIQALSLSAEASWHLAGQLDEAVVLQSRLLTRQAIVIDLSRFARLALGIAEQSSEPHIEVDLTEPNPERARGVPGRTSPGSIIGGPSQH
jgi:hypothetical protein